jgi:hypothetical protein
VEREGDASVQAVTRSEALKKSKKRMNVIIEVG